MADLKIFLKESSELIDSNFGGGARRKNAIFCSKFYKKLPKNAFSAFFQKFACGAENFVKIGSL